MRAAIDAITVLLLAVGCFFVFLGSFSLVKLSSFFHRIHGPTKSSTLGVGCILLASILHRAVHGSGPNGASACDNTTGPEPGPPPPCGVENVLCRLMCIASMPRSPGRTLPTMALKFAPSQ